MLYSGDIGYYLQTAARQKCNQPVPVSLRNAPAKLMKDLDHGAGYRYAHDEFDGFAAGAYYFLVPAQARQFYHPRR